MFSLRRWRHLPPINQSTNPPRTVVLHIVSPTKEVESDRAKHQHRHKNRCRNERSRDHTERHCGFCWCCRCNWSSSHACHLSETASVEVSPIPIRVRKVKLGISYSNQLSIRYCYYEVVPFWGHLKSINLYTFGIIWGNHIFHQPGR